MEAIKLRPEAWQKLLDADFDTSEAMLGMLALAEIVAGNEDLPQELADKLTQCAQDLIPGWVVTLNNWRLANNPPVSIGEQTSPKVASARKVGRSERCPCGSGLKYKKCCGLN